MNENFETLMSFIPEEGKKVDWEVVENSFLEPTIELFKNTHQRLDYHGEDDVWTHTKMVVDELVDLPLYKELDEKDKKMAFTSALFHDIGKIYTTVKENGEWTSPYHASTGAERFRELAKEQLGLSEDNEEEKNFIETVALLIGNHIKPMHVHQKRNPKAEAKKILRNQEIAEDFNLELLSILVEADMMGRISKDKENSIKTINRFRKIIKDLD